MSQSRDVDPERDPQAEQTTLERLEALPLDQRHIALEEEVDRLEEELDNPSASEGKSPSDGLPGAATPAG